MQNLISKYDYRAFFIFIYLMLLQNLKADFKRVISSAHTFMLRQANSVMQHFANEHAKPASFYPVTLKKKVFIFITFT